MNHNKSTTVQRIVVTLIFTLIVFGCKTNKSEDMLKDNQETITEYLIKEKRAILNSFQLIPTVALLDTSNKVIKILVSKSGDYLIHSEVADLKYIEEYLHSAKEKHHDLVVFMEVSPEDNTKSFYYLKLLRILKQLNITRVSFGNSPNQAVIDLYHFRNGKDEAIKDIQAGKLIIKVYGLPAEWFEEYEKILWDKYHIDIEGDGCDISDDELSYINNYNAISIAEIKRRFGSNILNKVEYEAKFNWKNK